MSLVIDAYNVLHVTGVLPPDLAGIDLDGLADFVETTRFGRDDAWIVCDGVRPPRPPRRRQRVWFSFSGPATADELIVALVRRSSAARRMTIVTSDRELAALVRRRGATVMSSEAFLASVVEECSRSKPRRAAPPLPALTQSAVREWLVLFGIDDLAVESSAAPKAERARPVEPPEPPRSPTAKPAASDDPLELAGLDMAQLLAGTPPERDAPRAPRRTRRDRR